MHQRLIAFLLCLLLLFPACALAAVTPREIARQPDEVPRPSRGYITICFSAPIPGMATPTIWVIRTAWCW